MSCSSSQILDPRPGSAEIDESKSPEKRKCPTSLFSNNLSSHEKRKSYAGDSSPTASSSSDWSIGNLRRPKRWSISEDISPNSESGSSSKNKTGPVIHISEH